MKTLSKISILGIAALIMVGCGKYEKNPVQDLEQMRANGKTEVTKGPDKPQVITNTVIVEKPVEVIKEQTTVDENFIVITADAEMNFSEGQAASFQVVGRSLIKGVGIRLTAQGLPAGAVFQAAPTAQEKDRYTLTWTPAYNTVASNSVIKSFKFKVSAQITAVPAGTDRAALEALSRSKELSVIVIKNQAAPTELAVTLPATVNEGTVTAFQVTVRVLGVDDKSGQKPRLVVNYDGAPTAQNELDGSRHVTLPQGGSEAQYVGDYRWKFNLNFDTQSISVQPSANSTVHFNVKVYAPSGSSTPEIVKKVQIVLAKSVEAPRFNFEGLAGQNLELTPGEATTLNFTIVSAAKGSSLKISLPNIKTLAGAPSLTCKASSKLSVTQQDCQISWKVPCAATDADITQQINMEAAATSAGRNSEVTSYTLKTVRSSKEKAATCTAGVTK